MWSTAGTCIFTVLGLIYITPILIVLMNSFKKKIYINKQPFILPSEKTWVISPVEQAVSIDKYGLLESVGWTVFITVGSVLLILLCTSMCAWYITRVQTGFTRMLYLLCVFSMVVPFQMVMFTLSLVADRTGLNTPWGIMIIYLGYVSRSPWMNSMGRSHRATCRRVEASRNPHPSRSRQYRSAV